MFAQERFHKEKSVMYQLSDFKKGLKVIYDGQPFMFSIFVTSKPGKGNQFTRCKLRNLLTGQNREFTFRNKVKNSLPSPISATVEMQFLYKDDNG